MPLVQTRGAASAQGFGEFAQAATAVNYIEDVFQTWLYTGNGTSQTITNNIDLSTKGGLVWIKKRNAAEDHVLTDTVRGAGNTLFSNLTDANEYDISRLSAFTSSGFSVGTSTRVNQSTNTYASWTFREQPKFFDVVTYTGTGSNTTIAHSLGVVPGSIIIKRTDTAAAWAVYHRSLANTQYLVLNTTAAAATGATWWNSTTPTSAVFSVGTDASVNASGGTYVAYIFAHDAGGFGLTGTDNVISCGSVTTDGSGNATVTLGYEPQWVLLKPNYAGGVWYMVDSMRGNSTLNGTNNTEKYLQAQSSAAEANTYGVANPTSTGFVSTGWGSGDTLIYIAIRRGPMKVPTTGTSVFDVDTRAGSASIAKTNSDILTDLAVIKRYTSASEYWAWTPRLVGNLTLQSNSTDAELSGAMATSAWDTMTGAFCAASNGATNTSTLVDYSFKRAPGFHDVVCYTGTGTATTFTHNLGVVPELMLVKCRSIAASWQVYSSPTTATKFLNLNNDDAASTDSSRWNDTTPTSSVFTVGTSAGVNSSGDTYVAYLFATLAGVSKVGSYTGTGTTQQINCGFTSGARFVLVKRTATSDPTAGSWYVWDSAQGIIAGNDPYLLLNSTAARVTGTDYIDTYSAGFEISSTAPAEINASGDTFIFLAIA